jgi:Acetyltransferases, including N-acetylases of ribosomal proteins
MIPRLDTGRLILRAFTLQDFEAWSAIMGDSDVMTFLGGPVTPPDAWRTMAMTLGHWMLRGFGMWAVERKQDGAMIGRVGLLQPEAWTGLEVGWTLGRPYWGQGYATEAAAAAMRYGFLTQPVDRLVSNIDPANLASQKVAQRLGETKGPKAELCVGGERFTVDVWSISRKEWQSRV